jgi:hypothetical protein
MASDRAILRFGAALAVVESVIEVKQPRQRATVAAANDPKQTSILVKGGNVPLPPTIASESGVFHCLTATPNGPCVNSGSGSVWISCAARINQDNIRARANYDPER